MESYNFLKHNPLSVWLYNKWLDQRCTGVEAFIFVATTGRSGTDSLAKIFSAIPGIAAFHEPYPAMINDYAFVNSRAREKSLKQLFLTKKRVYIKRAAIGHRYYAETNHMFIKNFFELAMNEFGERIKIVHLRRDAMKVALSFYSIDSIPGETRRGKRYLLDPKDESNLIKFPSFSLTEEENKILKCLWYWYEIEARIAYYKSKYPNLQWVDFSTDGLNNLREIKELFDALNIEVSLRQLQSVVGIRSNTKDTQKRKTFDFQKCIELNTILQDYLKNNYRNELFFDKGNKG